MRGEEVDRGARLVGVGEQLLDPPRGGRGRSADAQPGVDRLHRGGRDVVQREVLRRGARPEDLEVGLVPHLEGPVLDEVLEAVALGEVGRQVADEVVPALPVLRRRDDGGVLEDGLRRVGREVVRHEGQLDHRVEVEAAQVVVDPVDAGEVVHRLAVDLAVGADVVAEDPVGPDVGDAELAVGRGQRRAELLADRPVPGGVGRERVGEVLAADHRPPGPRQLADRRGGVDGDHDRPRGTGERRGGHRLGQLALDVHVGEGGDAVPPLHRRRAGRVGVRRVRDGEDVAARVVERLVVAVGRVGAVDLVADGTRHLGPGHRDLLSPGLGAHPCGRVQPGRVAAEGGVGALPDAVLPVAAGGLGLDPGTGPGIGHVIALPRRRLPAA